MDPVLNENSSRLVWIAEPDIGPLEAKELSKTVKEGWISQGKRVQKFEGLVSKSCGKEYGSACNSGTTALHLALHVLDVGPGDEVIIPNLTMIALANAVLLTGATPVFADSDANSEVGNVSLYTIVPHVTDKTKAVIVVHTYGEPAIDTAAIKQFCKNKNIKLIEDCAEAHFASLNLNPHIPTGKYGDLSVFSFYSNKNITTGEGGMVCTDDLSIKNRLDRVRMHAFTPGKHFCHTERAFGYRMTDMQAAIGIAQMGRASYMMRKRRDYRILYKERTINNDLKIARHSLSIDHSGVWVLPIVTRSLEVRDKARSFFAENGVDTRTYFQPMHNQSFLKEFAKGNSYPVSSSLGDRGFYLPLYPKMTLEDIHYISDLFNKFRY